MAGVIHREQSAKDDSLIIITKMFFFSFDIAAIEETKQTQASCRGLGPIYPWIHVGWDVSCSARCRYIAKRVNQSSQLNSAAT